MDREYSSGVYLKFNSSSEVDANKLEPLPIKYIAGILPLYDKTKKSGALLWVKKSGHQLT